MIREYLPFAWVEFLSHRMVIKISDCTAENRLFANKCRNRKASLCPSWFELLGNRACIPAHSSKNNFSFYIQQEKEYKNGSYLIFIKIKYKMSEPDQAVLLFWFFQNGQLIINIWTKNTLSFVYWQTLQKVVLQRTSSTILFWVFS